MAYDIASLRYLYKVVQAHALEGSADVPQLPHKVVLVRPPVCNLTLHITPCE